MEYEFYIPAKNYQEINPKGSLVISTLWTPPNFVLEKLERAGVDLSAENSPISIVGGLFGAGLKNMLRNILYNPQVDTIAVFGKDRSESGIHLASFFDRGAIQTGKKQEYIFEDGTIEELEKVKITGNEVDYYMDGLLTLSMFKNPPRVVRVSTKLVDDVSPLVEFIDNYTSKNWTGERIKVPMPDPVVDSFPSDSRAHVIVGESVFDAWKQLLVRLSRFGIPATFRSGKKRNELHNVKVVINSPQDYDDGIIKQYNLSPQNIRNYQESFLDPSPPSGGESYTYGNRLGAYFSEGTTPIQKVIDDLSGERDSRHSYITLWDNTKDILGGSAPCFASLFFRKIDDIVHLTATFRSHNGASAWPENALGLLRILEHVCGQVKGKNDNKVILHPGSISVISHSISIKVADLPRVQEFIDDELRHSKTIKMDPNGYLNVSISPEDREIVVQHFGPDNEFLTEYRGKRPQEIQDQIYRNCVISDLGHAMYIGGQLERAYICLHNGIEYKQDKAILIKE